MSKSAWRRIPRSSIRNYRSVTQLIRLAGYLGLQMGLTSFLGANKCNIYIGFLLLYPHDHRQRCIALVVGFLVGFLVDCYYDTLGLHALACTSVMQIKNVSLERICTPKSPNTALVPSSRHLGWIGFISYATCLAVSHHTILYTEEVWPSVSCLTLFRRAIVDGFITAIGITCIQIAKHMPTD